MIMLIVLFFFFKQKTAYEMRISDWSSDVCSSDLQKRHDRPADDRGAHDARSLWRPVAEPFGREAEDRRKHQRIAEADQNQRPARQRARRHRRQDDQRKDRKSTRLNSSH